jgi:hypothetical protein
MKKYLYNRLLLNLSARKERTDLCKDVYNLGPCNYYSIRHRKTTFRHNLSQKFDICAAKVVSYPCHATAAASFFVEVKGNDEKKISFPG